eukprot:gene27629-36435_t
MGTLAFEKFGSPAEVLKIVSSQTPAIVTGDSLSVKVKATQVLTEDIKAIKGVSFKTKNTGIAGLSAAGTVTSVNGSSSQFAVNDTVFITGSGLWAEEVTVSQSAAAVVKLPAEEAALLPAATSAWAILNNFVKLNSGDVVVQTNGSSATGLAIAEIGKSMGLKIISVTSAQLKDSKFIPNVLAENNSSGLKLAISSESGANTLALVRQLGPKGVLVTYSGPIEPLSKTETGVQIPTGVLIFKDITVAGFDFLGWKESDPSAFNAAVSAVTELSKAGTIKLKTSKVFSQKDYLKAIAEVEATGAGVVIKY